MACNRCYKHTTKDMKANELRIGNYVVFNYQNEKPKEVEVRYVAKDLAIGFMEPIPLTEDWLLKFGFEQDGELFHNQIALYKNGVGGFNYNVNYFEHENLEEIKHVHQLQNLYFALTGEELTIKTN